MTYKKNSISDVRIKAVQKLRKRLEKLQREERRRLRDLMGLLEGDQKNVLVVNERIVVIGNYCYKRFYPWKESFNGMTFRCSPKMIGRKGEWSYYKKGIRCDIVDFELEELYFRDKAYLMEKPSVDRINPHDDYRKDNCRYLEMSENSRRVERKARPMKYPKTDSNCNLLSGV